MKFFKALFININHVNLIYVNYNLTYVNYRGGLFRTMDYQEFIMHKQQFHSIYTHVPG